ncbi:MAG: hypothetical protein ABIO92_01225, partial [Chloroflexia bacterium]
MGRFEVTFRKFAILSGVRQEAGDYAICVHPPTANLQRRGTLMLMAEPAGLHASFGVDACRVAQGAVIEHYYGDHSLSLTSGLINALDSANNTLLQYNYEKIGDHGNKAQSGAVAVQGGGVATRKARVGLTAVLVRPDGGGIYIAQTAPAQLYIVHNGLLSALPHPPGWDVEQPRPVPLNAEQGDASGEASDEELVIPAFQAAPLGSRPGVEADLLFRRVEAGDLLVAVSSSLAKRLERVTAERLFTEGDADSIIEALHEMSMQLGIAEAHACVLQLGTDVRSGVETDFRSPLYAPHGEQIALNGGANMMPPGPEGQRGNDIKSALNSPRQWLQRRRNGDSHGSTEDAIDTADEIMTDVADAVEDEAIVFSAHPTDTLLNRTVERPPFHSAYTNGAEEKDENADELEFDGWEDTPPVLSSADNAPVAVTSITEGEMTAGRIIIKPSGHYERPMTSGSGALQQSPYKVPTLFGLAIEDNEEENISYIGSSHAKKRPAISITGLGRQAASMLATAVKNLAPERTTSADTTTRRPTIIPARILIAGGVLILSALLIFSILSVTSGGNEKATTNLLEQAKQAELLANQPNTAPIERKQHLAIALDKAKEARAANPKSNEAQLLVTKILAEIDKTEGVTRLSQLKQVFDLATIGKAVAASTPAGVAAPALAQVSGSIQVTNSVAPKNIVVQGNDAFILDSAAQKIYRCKLAAQNCAVALTSGESVGGQKVGKLTNLTSRVTNVVALDDARVAYIFDPDTNAWQSQPMGDANKLEQPKDIATYDGNFYLLDAKPGQVSKYSSGRYAEAPDDWIKDPASVAQLKEPLAMAIDGVIYVVLRDGKILAMQAGKVVRTI